MSKKPMWEQKDGENHRHYSWFETYLVIGPNRSIEAAYRNFVAGNRDQSRHSVTRNRRQQASSQWYRIAEQNQWAIRAKAWDEERRKEEERAQKELRNIRLRESADQDWEDGISERKKALDLLQMPLMASEVIDGIMVIRPVNVEYFRAATIMLCNSSALLRRSFEYEEWEDDDLTENVQSEPEMEVEDYENLTQSELNIRIEKALKNKRND